MDFYLTTRASTFPCFQIIKYQVRNITYSNRSDRVAQLTEHWGGIPKVVGSTLGVVKHILYYYFLAM